MEDSAGLFIPNIPPQINSRYIIKKELGKGAYGTVYFAVDRVTGEEYTPFADLTA